MKSKNKTFTNTKNLFHQYLINSLLVKRVLNILLASKMAKKESSILYFSQKRVHIKGELLEKFNEIWEKIKNSIKKKFHSEPVYNGKFLKAKIKSYNGKTKSNFHCYKTPKESSEFIY